MTAPYKHYPFVVGRPLDSKKLPAVSKERIEEARKAVAEMRRNAMETTED